MVEMEEFIRRFLQHVLPKGFVEVRCYGFLSSGLRDRLAALRQQFDCPAADQPPASEVDGGDGQNGDGSLRCDTDEIFVGWILTKGRL